jgi:hypothetical protein
MQPEISRRCRSCGAAVRAGARFCPQCGRQVDAAPGADVESARADAPATRETEPQPKWAPPTREFSAFVEAVEGGAPRGVGEAPAVDAQAPGEVSSPDDAAPEARRAGDDLRGARQVVDEAPVAFEPAPAPPTTREEAPVQAAAGGVGVASDETRDEARGRVARVREGTRARVERMREEALVVLEEAPDDSGLRFVVAAAALFLLFLLILLLSTFALR